jgi:heme/copper-type cytochrome/quinol oxidase subunit 2
MNRSLNIVLAVIAVLVIVAGGAWAMMSKSNQTASSGSEQAVAGASTMPQMQMDTSSPSDAMDMATQSGEAADIQTIEVEAGSFYFKPNEIHVKVGQKVKLVLRSADMMHDFNVAELGIKAPITKSGDTSTVEFVASKAGKYEYYCSVGQHRKMGQVGTLFVE